MTRPPLSQLPLPKYRPPVVAQIGTFAYHTEASARKARWGKEPVARAASWFGASTI